MATGDAIKYTDLIDEGAIEKVISNAEKLVEVFGQAEVAIKNAMVPLKSGLKGNPTTVEDVKQIQSLTKRVNELEGALVKTTAAKKELTIEVVEARVKQAEYNKELKQTARENLGLVDEYEKQSKSLSKMQREYSNLVLQHKANTVEARNLKDKIDALDFSIKRVDASVGKHQRNVGNYVGAVKKLGQGIGGLTGLFSTLGNVLGIDTESLERFHEISKEMIKVTKEFTHASHLSHIAHTEHAEAVHIDTASEVENTAATEASTIAIEEEVVAVEASNAAWLASPIGVVLAVGLAITAVVLAVKEFTKAEEDSAEAMHIFNEALNEQNKEITKLKLEILETSLANKVLTGEMSQGAVDRLHVQFKAIKEESDATFAHKNAIKKINEEYAKEELKSLREQQKHIAQGVLGAGNELEFLEKKRNEKLLILENGYEQQLSLIKIAAAEERTRLANEDIEKNKAIIEKANKDKLDLEAEYWKKLRDLRTENVTFEYERRKQEIWNNYEDEAKQYAGQTAILVELAIKRERLLLDLYREQQAEYTKILVEAEKEREEQIKKVQADAKKESEANPDPGFSKATETNIKRMIKQQEKKGDAEKEAAINLADDLYKIEKEAVERRNKLHMQEIDQKLERNKSAIEVQLALATAGQENTLQFELEKEQRLEKERQQEMDRQKKQAKRQEEIEIGLAFFKAFEKNLDTMKAPQAMALALTEVGVAKGLGKALAGNFAEGVENFQGQGTGTSDSNIIGFSHGESVVTAKGTEETPGLVSAINDRGLAGAMDWFKSIYNPNLNTGIMLSDVSKSQQANDSLSRELIEKVENLTTVMKNKPETKISFNKLGDVIKEVYQNGQRHTTIKKRSLN